MCHIVICTRDETAEFRKLYPLPPHFSPPLFPTTPRKLHFSKQSPDCILNIYRDLSNFQLFNLEGVIYVILAIAHGHFDLEGVIYVILAIAHAQFDISNVNVNYHKISMSIGNILWCGICAHFLYFYKLLYFNVNSLTSSRVQRSAVHLGRNASVIILIAQKNRKLAINCGKFRCYCLVLLIYLTSLASIREKRLWL